MIEGMDGVFAGGDCRSGPSTAIRAIEAGKTAAGNIDEYLGFHSVLPAPPEIQGRLTRLVELWAE